MGVARRAATGRVIGANTLEKPGRREVGTVGGGGG